MAGGSQDKGSDWGEQNASPRFIIGAIAVGLLAAWLILSMFSSQGEEKIEGETSPAERPADQAVHIDATPNYPVINPHTHCQGRYPLDYEMRDVCIRGQEEAKLTAHSIRIDDGVKALCAKRYIDDWQMYVVCAKNQMSAKLSEHSKPDRPEFDIVAMCRTKWPEDYSMEEHCIEGQEKARDEARNPSIDDAIAIRCTSKWPTSWEMFMYCVKQQTKAKSRLRL